MSFLNLTSFFSSRTRTNVISDKTPAEQRFELLRRLYVRGTVFAHIDEGVFQTAIDLEKRGMCDVRVGDTWKPRITITPRGRLLCEEIENVACEEEQEEYAQ